MVDYLCDNLWERKNRSRDGGRALCKNEILSDSRREMYPHILVPISNSRTFPLIKVAFLRSDEINVHFDMLPNQSFT